LRTPATVSIPLLRIGTDLFAPYTGLVLVLAMLLGGGSRDGLWSTAIVQLAALPLLAWALVRLRLAQLGRSTRWAIVILCAVVAVPLLQLIPLPPTVWSALPLRDVIADGYRAGDLALPWLPISLDPQATWRSLLTLLPAAACFLALLSLGARARRIMIALVLGVVFISVPLDLLQILGGRHSPLRFYEVTNIDRAVGFFANANHNAAALYFAIPFVAAWAAARQFARQHASLAGALILPLLLVMIFIGLAIIYSRAGIALGFAASISSLAILWRHARGGSRRRILLIGLGANLAVVLVAFQFGFVELAQRAENADIMHDARVPVARITSQVALEQFPYGTGMGTFVPIYQMHTPRTLLYDRYINHAHDDWLELWLTGGLPALSVALGFLVWFAAAAFRVWRFGMPDGSALNAALARAATISIALLMLHSIVDYPLRTPAISTLFAVACAILLPGARAESDAARKLGKLPQRSSAP
jgi:O-antigen ligase